MSGISVALRVRPLNSREQGTTAAARCLTVDEAGSSLQYTGRDPPPNANFSFDRVLGEASTQADTFEGLKDTVASVLEGFNATVLAYGQTGSGKTHTLLGDVSSPTERGVVPRAVAELAQGMARYPECRFKVTLSVIEIYNERIKDLLDPAKDNLQVIQDPVRGITVAEATELPVAGERDCVELMQLGIANRAVSATAMNAGSSRSHCVIYVVVEKAHADGRVEFGKLCLVDLAGSERQDKTGAVGQTATEGNLINKSLSALGNVVNALTDPKGGKHIPYRDSKLTRVLQDSLGGTARTVLIICCSPSLFNDAETLSSLRFGVRAKGIQNSVQANAVRRTPEQLAKALAAAQAEVEALKAQVDRLQGGGSNSGGSTGKVAADSSCCSSGGAGGGLADKQRRGGMSPGRKWALVGSLQLAGLAAYFAAVEVLGCA
ncbi:kinesin [Chlorella sorokiniana]|uniref:Kinesin-like protein n=1 Tax=Chlorella sorokiniana TaxID=3076 RepID=A0A2P6TS96_CHLSO|nr:kinesin [Chlorella sorokiniana]|eukprot:PRW56939.1 kinesin [Chlorella sorokiniana]